MSKSSGLLITVAALVVAGVVLLFSFAEHPKPGKAAAPARVASVPASRPPTVPAESGAPAPAVVVASPTPATEKPASVLPAAPSSGPSTATEDDSPEKVKIARAKATATIGGKEVALGEPNILGVYPRQSIAIGESVALSLPYPEAQAGEAVVAAVADGGQLNGAKTMLPLTLDDGRVVNLTFKASQEPGLFRVTLRRGLEVKTVELWAGPEPTYVARRADTPER